MEPDAAEAAAQIRAYVRYLRDLGLYDLYRRPEPLTALPAGARDALLRLGTKAAEPATAYKTQPPPLGIAAPAQPIVRTAPTVSPRATAQPIGNAQVVTPASAARQTARPDAAGEGRSYFDIEPPASGLPPELAAPMPKPIPFDELAPLPAQRVVPAQRAAALAAVRQEIGDCTRCPLAYAGRHTIVFADGDPNARLMFVGEGPGADEDASGLPFVGKAGQLLNNMIGAMGLTRDAVYIANIVKCRPPGNRAPEFVEAATCSQFLLRQIDIVQPAVIVALGSTAATYLLGVRQSLSSLRGRWHASRGSKVVVTYHPAFLLRDPRQKSEAWKDLQMVMAELNLKAPVKG